MSASKSLDEASPTCATGLPFFSTLQYLLLELAVPFLVLLISLVAQFLDSLQEIGHIFRSVSLHGVCVCVWSYVLIINAPGKCVGTEKGIQGMNSLLVESRDEVSA